MAAKTLLFLAALLGTTAIILGAFGAHALRQALEPARLESFQTGVEYQMYQALAFLALAAWQRAGSAVSAWIPRLWLAGTLCFSGSIYLLATRALWSAPAALPTLLGPITPIGGSLLIIGWLLLLAEARKMD